MSATRKRAFGKEVRRLRVARGTSLRMFADQLSLSPAYVSMVERDELPPPTERRMVAMAEALETDLDELLALGGRVPSDIVDILLRRPKLLGTFLRQLDKLDSRGIDSTVVLQELVRLLEHLPLESTSGTAPDDSLSFDYATSGDATKRRVTLTFDFAGRNSAGVAGSSDGVGESNEDAGKARKKPAR